MIPWRLILFLCILAIIILFIGFNITNASDISFGFYTFTSVPVFISLFIAFLFGAFVMLPFAVVGKKGKKKIAGTQNGDEPDKIPKKKKKVKAKKVLTENIDAGEIAKNVDDL